MKRKSVCEFSRAESAELVRNGGKNMKCSNEGIKREGLKGIHKNYTEKYSR